MPSEARLNSNFCCFGIADFTYHEYLWVLPEQRTQAGREGHLAVRCYLGLRGTIYPDFDRIFKAFEESGTPFVGGHTYNAHPVTAAVGLAVMNYVTANRIIEGVADKGRLL